MQTRQGFKQFAIERRLVEQARLIKGEPVNGTTFKSLGPALPAMGTVKK